MTLDLAADAPAFLADFAETVTYRPRSGASRAIQAVVDRDPPEGLSGAPVGAPPMLRVYVRHHATLGVLPASIDTGGDKIDLALRLGAAASTRSIVAVTAQDAGMVRLEVR